MREKDRWETAATTMLRVEMVRRNLSYEELRLALEKIGIFKSTMNLTKTISLGKFSFAFFLMCAKALNISSVEIRDTLENI